MDVPESETQRQIIYAKLDPATGITGEGDDEEEVLGYLEVEPSDDSTFYLPSQQIEINGEHVILTQQEESGDIIVVVRTEQDGEEGTILMETLEESKSSNEGDGREDTYTEVVFCDESPQHNETKESINQKLLQLACLADEIDHNDHSSSSSSKLEEVIVIKKSDITIAEESSAPKPQNEITTITIEANEEEEGKADNGNIFDKIASNKGWIGKEGISTLEDTTIETSSKDSEELSNTNISNGHSPERIEHSSESHNNSLLETSEINKSNEAEYDGQHISFSDESIELSSDKIDECISNLQDVNESALSPISPKEKEPEVKKADKEKSSIKRIIEKRSRTPKSAVKPSQLSNSSVKKKLASDTPPSKKKKTLDKFDLIKMQKPPSLNPLFRLIKPKSVINATKLLSLSSKTKKTVPKTSTPISKKRTPEKRESPYTFEAPSSPPLKKYRSSKSSRSVQLSPRCDIRIRIQNVTPIAPPQNYKCTNCSFTTTRLNNMMFHCKKLCSNENKEYSWNNEQMESTSATVLLPEKPPVSKADTIGKGPHRVENPLESSDSEEEFIESKTKQSLGFKKHDVVWIEWRDLHRPALIKDVLVKEKKALVMYIDSFVPNSEVKIPFKRMSTFDNAERNKKFLSEGKDTTFGTSVVKAVQKAEDYLRKRCLGYAIKPLQFFAAPTVSQDSLLTEETSDVSDNEGESNKGIERLFKLIKNEKVKNHLLGVFSTTISSERHLKFHSRSSEEKEQLKQTSWFGPVADLTQQEQIYDYCLALFKQSCKYGKNYDVVAYMFEVWVPEAIIKAISLINKASFEEAAKFFSDTNNKGVYLIPTKSPPLPDTPSATTVSTSDTTTELLSLEF